MTERVRVALRRVVSYAALAPGFVVTSLALYDTRSVLEAAVGGALLLALCATAYWVTVAWVPRP